MKNVVKFIRTLNDRGIYLFLKDDKLKARVEKGAISEALGKEIKANEEVIISYLQNKYYPLSYAQERLWFMDQYTHNDIYNMPEAIRLSGRLNTEVLEKTLWTIVSRHEILRTNFVIFEDEPKQYIHENPTFKLEEIDFNHLSKEEADKQILDHIHEASQKPFDLVNDSLIRFILYTISEEESVLFMNKHHIVSDGWSYSILIEELTLLYDAFSNDKPSPLNELQIQYGDYAIWQKEYLVGEVLDKQTDYWKHKLEGVAILELPTDKIRPKEKTYNGRHVPVHFNKEITDKLNQLSRENDTTLFMTLLSIFKILLHKYTGQVDICIGSPIANRTREEVEGVIGLFVNTLTLRSDVNPELSVTDFLSKVKATTLEAYENQDIPFEKVVDIAEPDRNLSYSPLFQVMMVLQNNPEGELKFSGLNIESVALESVISVIDIALKLNETPNGISGFIEYNTDLFNRDRIERMLEHFKVLAESIISKPDSRILDLEMLTTEEKHLLLTEWNDTDVDFPKEKCIHQIFEDQVKKTPDNIAVVYGEEELTYRQLNEKSNQVAHYLKKRGVKPESLVGLCVGRSTEMIVGLLGILKAGGAYVPIDPTYPKDRITYILEDSDCKIVLTQQHLEIPKDNAEIIYLDSDLDKIANESNKNVKSKVKSNNLAYVIYTSGSTGKPKGVMLEHSGISNLQQEQGRIFEVTESDIILQFASLSFDASVWEIFMALTKSAKLVLCKSEDLVDVSKLTKLIDAYQISIVTLPPTILNLLDSDRPSLKTVISAGEDCTTELAEKWARNSHFFNAYGPTETTVCASVYKCNIDDVDSLSIGKPLGNNKLYVLDKNLKLAPIGVAGELCVSGESLARGYHQRPELTAQKFIDNPYDNNPDSRLYRTGDLVKYLSDGNIKFIGRIDDQVKIRGFRIELGEIESALSQQQSVSSSVILAREDQSGNKQLVAYMVPAQGTANKEGLNIEKLREALSKILPDYMVPSLYVSLDAMPLTTNGKIDKDALPEPEVKAENDHVAPSSKIEESVVEIWAEVLGIDKNVISINKSFFEIGGNSLLSVKLQQKLNLMEEFKAIQVSDLFKYHTISKLVQSVRQGNVDEFKLQKKTQTENHEIAIIGMSGAFSGVRNIAEYWDLIKNQNEGVQFYSKEECEKLGVDLSSFDDPDYIPVSGQVKDIDQFDPSFWDISPNEAKLMDPQIRKFIEHCWFVLESSGYIHLRKESNIGVFAGSGNTGYLYDNIVNGESASQINLWEAFIVNSKAALTTKTSYMLGLSGPSNSISTACSTGLVSVVEACKNLQFGICEMALAGGVSLVPPNNIGYTYSEGMILSKDGHCRTFDEEASGSTGGSGVAVVLLKRLEDAIEDNDNIIGVIKGYASNNDGDRKTDFTAPSVTGQAECIINAQKMAGISSDEIDFVECHGTATNLGDPVEVQALKEAFEFNSLEDRSNHKTILGAVKANIGHADTAAGTAGLIKVCLMLQNNIIPGQPNFNTPNPKLNIDQTNFEITKENQEWLPSHDHKRMAGVSAFGLGGTNAHVIVGDYIPNNNTRLANSAISESSSNGHSETVNYIVPISAKSKESLESYKQQLIASLEDANGVNDIKDIAYTLQERRAHFNYRSAYSAKDVNELINNLKQYSSTKKINTDHKNKIVFMFPGQGAQYPGMAKELYDNEAFFKTTIDKLISLANVHLDIDLFDVMFPENGDSQYDLDETRWAQISMFIIEYALAEYIEHLGIEADAYIGHSLGEYVAATFAGIFKLEDAIKVVIARGNLLHTMELGSMLAINAKEEDIKDIVKENNCEISLINSLDDIVVSGSREDIKSLKISIDKAKLPAIVLNTSYASHSKMIEKIESEFKSIFSDIRLKKPRKLYISNYTGEFANDNVSKSGYWYRHLRNTVQFAKGVNTIGQHYNNQISFIQIGPADGLTYFVNKYKNANNYKSIKTVKPLPSAKEGKNKTIKNLNNKEDLLAKFWVSGVIDKLNDVKVFDHANTLSNLPTYQFNYKKCWLEPKKESSTDGQLKALPKEKWFSTPIWSALTNLDKSYGKKEGFKNALVFIRKDQLNSYDFTILAEEIHFIVLDTIESLIGNYDNSDFLFSSKVNEHDFEKIAEQIKQNNIEYDAIIHASSVNNVADFEDALGFGFYSLFLIHKYLLNANSLKNVLVLTNGLSQITNVDVINPENGAMIGAIRTINHEFPDIDARVIDVGFCAANVLSSVVQILNDDAHKKSEDLLAIRFEKVWKQKFDTIDSTIPEVQLIEEEDIILITGGVGGIGLANANYISSKHNVTFILVSRSNIYEDINPSASVKQKLEIIDGIKANGSVVDIQSFDISDEQEVIKLKEYIDDEYGRINGIMHAAGVKPLTLDIYDLDNVKNAFKGKVYGIHNIINTLNLRDTKYIVSTSSLASVMGDINRIEYCASNSYLDYLSLEKNCLKGIKFLATNWLGWIGTGMLSENSNEEAVRSQGELEKLLESNSVSQEEGAEMFYRLINQSNYDQVAISKFDTYALKSELFEKDQDYDQDVQLIINDGRFSATEFKIAQIWNQVLGVEEIGIHDNFFELGGNSILATRVISKIRTEYSIELPLKTLFAKPSLVDFSKIIENTKSKPKIEKIEVAKSEDLFKEKEILGKEDSPSKKREKFKL